MSDNPTLAFGKFVPGFDFLQNLARGASQTIPQMPNVANWIAPTLNVEELDKRIGEMRAVHFWLEQNSKALSATIQALEVQKMTLATLRGMNVSMGELAESMRARTSDAMAAGAQRAADTAAAAEAARSARGKAAKSAEEDTAKPAATATASVVDPLQWWGALTQQFQKIASDALKDAARNTAMDTARTTASDMARDATQGAADGTRAATGTSTKTADAKPAPAKKARKTPARRRAAADKT
ncbi:PhaM family polyhydroxyalkanoate granule multifunctional regulatory protein [Ramlibacter sp. Leaf400]|uniref:PhaM family polyhydroxyalkanoate granule multifunctional regulatory protein n=1 Tax=Ramlibacter sp. Leaf400 TaxID=1736365 RepID=UPI0006F8AC0C|nr:PhaM family polyhydroxyalkanoate granule multifunctional regulatory protein [Ramlibacter sp. Leaf400]KQT12443.1 hypothetical protein ASG30_03895 [Ramlibacter sp. Leaf400]